MVVVYRPYDMSSANSEPSTTKPVASIFDRAHDITMSRVPEVGYDSFDQLINPAHKIIIILLIAIASSALLSFPWFSVVFGHPTDVRVLADPQFDWDNTTNDPNNIFIYQKQLEALSKQNLQIQCLVIFLSLVFVRFVFVKFTGESQDPYLLIFSGLSELFLHPKYSGVSAAETARKRASVLGKILFILIGQLLGWVIGFAVFVAWARNIASNDDFRTEDCAAINFTSAPCSVLPRYDENKMNQSTAIGAALLSILLSFASYFIGYTMVRHKEHWMTQPAPKYRKGDNMEDKSKKKLIGHKNVTPFGFAVVSALGPAGAHLVFAHYVGVSHNTWFWLISAIFTNGTQQAAVYAWPGLVIGLAVLISFFAYHMVWSVSKDPRVGRGRSGDKYAMMDQ